MYEREVFFTRPIGFIEPAAARRISYQDSLAFERRHEAVYREHGFEIVDGPAARIAQRAEGIAAHIAARS